MVSARSKNYVLASGRFKTYILVSGRCIYILASARLHSDCTNCPLPGISRSQRIQRAPFHIASRGNSEICSHTPKPKPEPISPTEKSFSIPYTPIYESGSCVSLVLHSCIGQDFIPASLQGWGVVTAQITLSSAMQFPTPPACNALDTVCTL